MKLGCKKQLQLLILILAVIFVGWFVTAPAAMAVERIVAGTGNGPISGLVIRAAECYERPMYGLCKYRWVSRVANVLGDWWCDVLDAPDTTP